MPMPKPYAMKRAKKRAHVKAGVLWSLGEDEAARRAVEEDEAARRAVGEEEAARSCG